MAQARISLPTKTTMQSGRGNGKRWLLEYEMTTPRRPEPLMGWVASGDTLNQIRLRFDTKEDAVAFAERKGMTYTVVEVQGRRVQPRNYGDNFKPMPPKD